MTKLFVIPCVVALVSVVSSVVTAAPWSDDETKRRFAHGVDLSAQCRVESLRTKRVTGENCLAFSTWLAKDFPILADNLPGMMQRSPDITPTYTKFVETLEAITAIGELSDGVDTLLDTPREPL